MAIRIEKESTGNDVMIIDGWNGIASDPYSGTNTMLQVNLETAGEVSVGYPLTANAISGGTLGTPIARSTRLFGYGTPGIPSGSPQSFAILDATGQPFESTSIAGTYTLLASNLSTTGASSKDGCIHWLGYYFKTRNTNIDYWNGSTWVNGWQTTLIGGFKHYAIVASDNGLYITNGNYVASIIAPTPTAFDPTNTATFSFKNIALQIPVTDIALSLAEVGGGNTPQSTLLVGGSLNAIYPWNKTDPSFAEPFYVGENYIGLMISVNQSAFIFPGNVNGRGFIYIYNGTNVQRFFKIPDYMFGEQDPYYQWGDAIFHRNNLLFSFFITRNSTASLIPAYGYIWALDLETNVYGQSVSSGFRAISVLPLTPTLTSRASCLISTLNLSTPGFGFIYGLDDNGINPGIGYSGTTVGIGIANFLTEIIPVGTFLQKKTNSTIEFKLRSPLQSGETLSITPIVDGIFGSALTFNPSITTGSISGYASVNFQNAQWLQFSVSLTGNSALSGVRFKEIRIR